MIGILGGRHVGGLAGRLQKLDPNESGSLDCFTFVRWYVELVEVPGGDKLDEEVSMESTEEAEWE